jgi:chemotaxis protein methyltransferase CheR
MTESDLKTGGPLQRIRRHVHEEYGIYYPDEKTSVLRSSLRPRVQEVELDSLREYADFLEDNPDEIPAFLDAITTNKTYFFREEDHWTFMDEQFLEDRPFEEPLRIWSAACSSGEEPYTAAFLTHDSSVQQYRILASDISEKILRTGTRGIYTGEDLEPVDDYCNHFRDLYFEETDTGVYRVRDVIKKNVHFRQFNLTFDSNPFQRGFDLILLRNVLIYFDDEMIRNVIRHCERLLNPGGYLFIGHTENIDSVDHGLKYVQPSIFRKAIRP